MAVGLLGKLPSHGDFLRRRRAVRAGGHRSTPGCAAAVAASRETLGEGWLDAYLTAPVWRFALAAGTLRPRRRRRHLAAQRRPGRALFPAACRWRRSRPRRRRSHCCRAAQRVVRSAGGAGPGRAGGPSDPAAARGEPGRDRATRPAERRRRCPGVSPRRRRRGWHAGGAGADRQPVVGARARRASPASLLACAGLPPPSTFAAMLDGGFPARGWAEAAA